MDEEKKAEKAIEKTAVKDTDEGDKPKATTIVEQANEAAKRMETANTKREELIRQEQDIDAKRALGGETEGAKPEEKPKELTDVEYKDAVMKGEIPKK